MGLIIIGFIIAAIIFFLPGDDIIFRSWAIFLVIIGAVIAGIFFPIGGYKPIQEIETIELVALRDQTTLKGEGSFLYLSINATNAYTFYMQIESDFADKNSKAYVSKTIEGSNITVVEQENCQSPRLVKYSEEPYVTFWSFAMLSTIEKYVFYVPKGTIAYEFSLG